MEERYNHLNKFLKEKYGERVLKICIDGGFTCPNRDGKCGYGGCIFCSEKGSGEHIKNKDIKTQINSFLNSYRGKRANKFIAYFQNFTNTYDTIENLRAKYDEALNTTDKFVALSVATRPDCINEDIVKLLASYKNRCDVYVELGFQTASEEIGKTINRCYTNNDFTKAVNLLNKYNIDIITHIMLGLPMENKSTIDKTINFLNKHNISGLKIHSTYIVKNTGLENMYNKGLYTPLTLENYISNACYILTKVNPKLIIHRISGDAPKDILIAPEWNSHKKWIMNGIEKYLLENNLYQGMYFKH